jgi:hypothetical protein
VAHFGSALEAELESVEGKNSKAINGKRKRIMTKWLDMPQKFRAPMSSKAKKQQSEVEQEVTVQGDMF